MALMFRDVHKDATLTDVHVSTALGNEGRGKARPFSAFLAGRGKGPVNPIVMTADGMEKRGTGRKLVRHDETTVKVPFPHDPKALAVRPDQMPRLLGALTDPDKLDVKDVRMDQLTAAQNRVDPEKVDQMANSTVVGGKLPVVVRNGDKHLIVDGHHRLTAAWLNGAETAKVRFKDITPMSNAMKSFFEGSIAAEPEVGPQPGDIVSVHSDKGAASNAPWESKVLRADGFAISVAYDDGASTYQFDPKDLKERVDRDGVTHWHFLKVSDPPKVWKTEFRFAKADTDRRLVFGWASVVTKDGQAVIDKQDDIIPVPELEQAVYEFVLNSRDGGDMHVERGMSRLVESMVFDKQKQDLLKIDLGFEGWWTGWYVDSDDLWKAYKDGRRPEFSIGGAAVPVEVK